VSNQVGRGPESRKLSRWALVLSVALVVASLLGESTLAKAQPASATNAGDAPAAAENAPVPSAPPAALAESLRGMARADYAAARILYEDGDYAGAFTKLEAAYLASRDPRLLWNMAACEKELRHYASVITLLERYLREGENIVAAEERAATAELLETVRAFVNELSLAARPEGAKVFIDDIEVATAPIASPLRVDMGKHKLRVALSGFVTHEAVLDLPGGKAMSLEVELAAERHEGTLRIVSDPNAVISVDGKVVGTASWVGPLATGSHIVHVTAAGKQPHKTEVVIADDATSSLHVNLLAEPSPLVAASQGNSVWWWVIGGVALAGAGVSTYLLLRPGEQPEQPELGTWGGFEL
jgi:hypothetical protein